MVSFGFRLCGFCAIVPSLVGLGMADFGDLVALCLFGSVLVSGCWWFVGFGGGLAWFLWVG